ncbi:hypothetical protein KM043_005922 [Ampulex compressa]|nr:hypothetical protein KM043_005922 [Ampulex compressa]
MTLFDAKSALVESEAVVCNDYSLQLNRWFLEPLGAWPESSDRNSKSKQILSRVLILACFSLIGLVIVPCALNVIYEEKDDQVRLKTLGPMSHWIMGAINYSSLLFRAGDILGCVRHMETDWRIAKRLEDREVMMRHAKIGRFVAGFCAMFMHGGTLSYSIIGGIESAVTVIGNDTVLVRMLPFPFYSKIWDTSRRRAQQVAFGRNIDQRQLVSKHRQEKQLDQSAVYPRAGAMRGSPRKSNVVENTAKANSEYSLQLNRWFLKPVGAWPSIVMTRTEKILTRALIFVCCTMISITLVPCVLNMLYEEENKQLRVKAMGAVGHWLMGGINYCSLLLHGGDIIDCMEHIATDWKIVTGSEHRRIMLRHAEIGRFIAGFCAMFMHGSTLSYSIVRGIDIDTAVIGNETVLVRLLPFPFYNKIWDARFSPAYEVVFGTQIASCFVVNSTTVGACSLAAVFAMHACGQLHVLMSRLKDLVRVDEEDVRFSEKRLAIIVEHHLRVLRFVRRIEDIMNQVCLVEVLGGTLHMCILGYFIITSLAYLRVEIMTRFSRGPSIVQKSDNDNSEYSLQLNRWFLKPVGAWPTTSKTRAEKSFSVFLICGCYSLISMALVPCVLNLLYEEKDNELRLNAIGSAGHWLMGGISYCSLLLHGSDILRCVEHIEADWRIAKDTEHRRIMLRHAEFGRFLAGFCAMFMHGSIMLYSMIRGKNVRISVIGNETEFVQLLPAPFYNKIWDTRFSPAYEVVYGIQIASFFIVNSTTVGICSLAAIFVMHACGQLNLLMLRLNDLIGDDREDIRFSERRLAGIVEDHLRVLRFISRIEEITHQVCLVEVLGGTLHMCLLGYFIITRWEQTGNRDLLGYVILYISMSFNIFIFCYIAEILAEKCEKISEVAYMTDWYRLPRKIALGMVLIISRANVIPRITAGKIIQLSILTFGDAVRTSMVYINMLRTMMPSSASVDL